MAKVYNIEVKLRKGEDSEHLIRRFQREVKKEGIVKEVMSREYHLTKSQKRKLKKLKSKNRSIAEARKAEKSFDRNKKLTKKYEKREKKDSQEKNNTQEQ
jgi:ribosomal protein S21